MSIFKHIAHPAFDETPGQPRAQSSINPKTGKREYFLGALLSGAGMAARLAMPAIRTAATVGAKAAGTALRTGAKYAGQAAKVGSKYAGQAAKVGSKYAGQAAKTGVKYAGQAGQYVAKNALPAIKAAGTQIAKAAPDALAGYAQFQQQKDMRNQQNRILDIMAGMNQPQYQGQMPDQQNVEQPQPQMQEQQQEIVPQQYNAPMPQYEPQYQPQYQQEQMQNPYGGQQMDYQNPMDYDPSRAYYAGGGMAHKKHRPINDRVAHMLKSPPPSMNFDPVSFGLAAGNPISLLMEVLKMSPAGQKIDKMQEDSAKVKGLGMAGDMITGKDGYTKKNAINFFNKNPSATKQDFGNHIQNMQQSNYGALKNAGKENFDANRKAKIQAYGGYAPEQQNQQQPKFLVPDNVVQQRIEGVMNRSPDLMSRMSQEMGQFNQG